MKPIRKRRIRHLLSASLALAFTGMTAGRALADAADPKRPSDNPTFFRAPTAVAHDNGNGTTTVTVIAQTPCVKTSTSSTTALPGDCTLDSTNPNNIGAGWVWTTHHADCNTDRAGTGFAVDWDDPQDPGNHVTTLNNVSIDVGSTLAVNGNAVDNVVHPTPGTKVTSLIDGTGKETDVATPSQFALWRSGCGIDTRNIGGNSVNDPEGDWGPRNHVLNSSGMDTGPQNGGISHTYLTSDLHRGATICAVFYDVHAGMTPVDNGGVGIPSKASEITAGGSGHNTDNSVQGNSGTPVGNACVTITVITQSSMTTGPSALPNDSVTVTGNSPTGTATFELFSPSDSTCSGTPAYTQTVSLSGGTATTTNTTFVASTNGTWRWRITYNGDANNAAQTTTCGFETFTITNGS